MFHCLVYNGSDGTMIIGTALTWITSFRLIACNCLGTVVMWAAVVTGRWTLKWKVLTCYFSSVSSPNITFLILSPFRILLVSCLWATNITMVSIPDAFTVTNFAILLCQIYINLEYSFHDKCFKYWLCEQYAVVEKSKT